MQTDLPWAFEIKQFALNRSEAASTTGIAPLPLSRQLQATWQSHRFLAAQCSSPPLLPIIRLRVLALTF